MSEILTLDRLSLGAPLFISDGDDGECGGGLAAFGGRRGRRIRMFYLPPSPRAAGERPREGKPAQAEMCDPAEFGARWWQAREAVD